MIYEIGCQNCGGINRNEVPLPSKDEPLDLNCYNCDSVLITFYSDKSIIAKAIKKTFDKRNQKKVIKD